MCPGDPSELDRPFASRAGEKLSAALDIFGVHPAGWVCADFGANVGGFTDCLLRRGAERVYAVDTGYGELAWVLRKHPRVTVLERTNALHCDPPEPVDLVVIDVAWTPQVRIVPAALRWLRPDGRGQIVSLLKPHYELAKLSGRKPHAPLTEAESHAVCRTVCERLYDVGALVRAVSPCVITGKGGNREYLLWIVPRERERNAANPASEVDPSERCA